MDTDLEQRSRQQLIDEVRKLRNAIRAHRDSKLPGEDRPIPVVIEHPVKTGL